MSNFGLKNGANAQAGANVDGGADSTAQALAIAAFLLDYPDDDWYSQLPTVRHDAVALSKRQGGPAFTALADAALSADPSAFESAYVHTFDFGKTTSLQLTSRGYADDGQKRMGLLAYSTYFTESGFEPADTAPDYLPSLLDLAAQTNGVERARILKGARADIKAFADELEKAETTPFASVYVGVLKAVLGIADACKEAA